MNITSKLFESKRFPLKLAFVMNISNYVIHAQVLSDVLHNFSQIGVNKRYPITHIEQFLLGSFRASSLIANLIAVIIYR